MSPRSLAADVSEATRAVVVRHPRERGPKCTMTPLVDHPRIFMLRDRPGQTSDATGLILLAVDAPELSPRDRGQPLLLLDATWRRLPAMRSRIVGTPALRSLPRRLETAYPRRSRLHPDPTSGLATVEALYAAARILGFRDDSFLDGYRWRDAFLERCERAGLP